MTKRTMAVAVVLAAVLAGAWSYRASQAQALGSGVGKLATVNIAKVMTECREYLDREEVMRQRTQEIQEELNRLGREADEIREELENALQPGSEEYNEQLMKWFEKGALREALEKGQTRLLTGESEVWTEQLYQRVTAEVARVARQQGADVVLNVEDEELTARNLQELSLKIRTRIVVWSTATLDITAIVMENLDREYQTRRAQP